MKRHSSNVQLELATAEERWPEFAQGAQLEQLRFMVSTYGFSVIRSDLQILNGRWYVTHAALLNLAQRRRCRGLHTEAIREFCDPGTSHWTFKAVAYKSRTCKGFVGYGDADPSNVSLIVRGAEMRVAETRAVNRALRKAYGIGICSVEEIGSIQSPVEKPPHQSANGNGNGDGNGNAAPKLRTGSANSSASISSILNSSRPTPQTSVA